MFWARGRAIEIQRMVFRGQMNIIQQKDRFNMLTVDG